MLCGVGAYAYFFAASVRMCALRCVCVLCGVGAYVCLAVLVRMYFCISWCAYIFCCIVAYICLAVFARMYFWLCWCVCMLCCCGTHVCFAVVVRMRVCARLWHTDVPVYMPPWVYDCEAIGVLRCVNSWVQGKGPYQCRLTLNRIPILALTSILILTLTLMPPPPSSSPSQIKKMHF